MDFEKKYNIEYLKSKGIDVDKNDDLYTYGKFDDIIQRKKLRETKLENLNNVSEGLHTCKKCGSKRTICAEVQLRGADEPMTQFVTCSQCGSRWVAAS